MERYTNEYNINKLSKSNKQNKICKISKKCFPISHPKEWQNIIGIE